MTGTVRNLKEKLTGDCAEPLEKRKENVGNCSKTLPRAQNCDVRPRFACLGGTARPEMCDQLQQIPENPKETGPGSCPES